jgi:4'-phosphopantetheinyl transferase EntD
MPLIKQFKTPENSNVSLWLLNEDFENLKAQANFLNIDLRESFYKNEQQHKEYLASRIALKKNDTTFTVDEVDEKSAPILKNSSTQISISHCKKMCSTISNHLHPVGIDVEVVTTRILNISERFMNSSELDYLSNNEEENLKMQFIIWSSKESVFKKYHSLHLDFRENIFVEKFSLAVSGILIILVKADNIFLREKIFYHFFDDVVLTHTL